MLKCIVVAPLLIQDFELRSESPDAAMFALRSDPPADLHKTQCLEQFIEDKYLHEGVHLAAAHVDALWRVHSYRSTGAVAANSDVHLNFYFVQRPTFPPPDALLISVAPALQSISDVSFFKRASPKTHALYWSMLQESVAQLHPVVRLVSTRVVGEMRLVVAYSHGSTHSLFSSLSALFYANGLYSTKVPHDFDSRFQILFLSPCAHVFVALDAPPFLQDTG